MTGIERSDHATAEQDGRAARRERNRAAIVDAIMVLISSGESQPTVARIAELSGVSERSIFRIFESRDALFAAVIQRQSSLIDSLMSELPTSGPLADRVHALAEQRARHYEEITPMRLVALRTAERSELVAQRLGLIRQRLRDQLASVLGAELETRSVNARREAIAALDLVSSWDAWHTLRTDEGFTVARSTKVMEASITAIVSSA
jgi:AcrR family transcriptional regulator